MFRLIMAAFAVLSITTAASAAEKHFSNLHRFEDFPVKVEVSKAPLQLSDDIYTDEYLRTVIRETYEQGSNFGAHFTIAAWGCGTECWNGVIVDQTTGEVVALGKLIEPEDWGFEYGFDFRVGSNLLIVNPAWEKLIKRGLPPSTPVTYYYLWNGQRFVLFDQEKWSLLEPMETESISPSSWKAVAYTQDGDVFFKGGFPSEFIAAHVVMSACSEQSKYCELGVVVTSDQTIVVDTCHRAPAVHASHSLSAQNLESEIDSRLQQFNAKQRDSCVEYLRY